ncbi:4-Hydroxy-2-oxoglutarate aldolase [Desulfocucumis palustris]|uniref:4-Hydroxy-2-oxoglutarate aldolase n=1 Tax=Desulfocucumis palustris TaxID=1898651 RepID=A0A2L2XK32_9FIRM|nr:bifunctional 2-keto-4-hydroxyglutarate aldolase/2-keto-3-deoxy-6-phosphogluconate aldolase [Desulfocucumis palustris]GBF34271.1 4-Hydroxy-2-oxoglutarate aldolase [Desulfocucumis palustris]
MKKSEVLETIEKSGVVAVVRVSNPEELLNITEALLKGGLKAIEITMTTPGALEAIKEIKNHFGGGIIIGAGSVLDAETARLCILQGAEFVVSPIFNRGMVDLCKRYSTAVIPGAFTPTEILTAWEAGGDVIKVFPATSVGHKYFKDIKGPLPQVKLTPTGGVSLENAGDFIRAGAAFVGVGGNLVDKRAVAEKRWSRLTENAGSYLEKVASARNN